MKKSRKPKIVIGLAPEIHWLEVSYVSRNRDLWSPDNAGVLRDNVEQGVVEGLGIVPRFRQEDLTTATRTLGFEFDSEKQAHKAAEAVFDLYEATGARHFEIRVTESMGYVATYERGGKGEPKSFSIKEHGHRCDRARAFGKRLGIGAKNSSHRSRGG